MTTSFYKCNGNGNTFIIVIQDKDFAKKISKNKIKNICKSIDNNITDGFISVYYKNNVIITNYYNNDGNWETFCLNGLRCVALIMSDKINKKSINITMNDIIYRTKVNNDDTVSVRLKEPIYKMKDIIIDDLKGDYICSGSKHFVCDYSKEWLDNNFLKLEMRKIRYHDFFKPNGLNVNYYKVIGKNIIQIKTYEKGIEKIMKSCSSGSYACAYDYSKKNNIYGKIKVLNDGGISQITFRESYINNLFKGVAEIEYKGKIEI